MSTGNNEQPFSFNKRRPDGTGEQTPHSGVNHNEYPVDRLPASLADDVEAGNLSDWPPVHPNPPAHDVLPSETTDSTIAASEPAASDTDTAPAQSVDTVPRSNSRRNRWLAGAAGVTLVLTGGSVALYKTFVSPVKDAFDYMEPDTTTSSPLTPGEASGEQDVEPSSGISLSPNQVAIYESGDQEAIDELNDKIFIPKLEKALQELYTERVNGTPADLSTVTDDESVVSTLRNGVSQMLEPNDDNPEMFAVGVCPIVYDEGAFGGGCEDRTSATIVLGEPLREIATTLRTMDDPLADNLDNRLTINFNDIALERDGDTLKLAHLG